MPAARKQNGLCINREYAFATGVTAVDIRQNRDWQHGRAWTLEDRNIAASRTNAMLLYVPANEGGLAGFTFTFSMIEDLGLTVEQVLKSGNKIAGHNGGPA